MSKKSINTDLAKVPPHAPAIEEAVLGAMMLEPGAFESVAEKITAEAFYSQANQTIFRAIANLNKAGRPVDILTVVEELNKMGQLDQVGGAYYVAKLTNNVVSSANIETHSLLILEKYIQREVIKVGGQLINCGYDSSMDAFDLLETAEASISKISTNNIRKDFHKSHDLVFNAIQRIEKLRSQDTFLTGVPSGFRDLDAVTHGWQPTDLIILAARPSVGKTAFALNLARNAQVPVGIFSMEMSASQLINRMLSAETGIFLGKIQSGKISDQQLTDIYQKGAHSLAEAPIFIDDTAGITIQELRIKARIMMKKHGIGLLVIDYLQLMTGDSNKSENREREIAKISRELKKLAKDMDIPVIALSQLSRAIESRTNKTPQLSDLRESGAIEQDADIVAFLYRPAEDDIKRDPELNNTGTLKIAKHRNGSLAEIHLGFFGQIQKWMNLDEALAYEDRYRPKPQMKVHFDEDPFPID